jgi:hypothetical protein
MNPVQELGNQRAAIELMDSVRSTIYFGIEPNARKYLVEIAALRNRLGNGDLQPYLPAYNQAIAGVKANDPTYSDKLLEVQQAIQVLNGSLESVIANIQAIRLLNPLLLPHVHGTT